MAVIFYHWKKLKQAWLYKCIENYPARHLSEVCEHGRNEPEVHSVEYRSIGPDW